MASSSSSLIDTLRSVLCCCLGEQRQAYQHHQQNLYQHELPDENTLLITPNEPTISYGDISYQDQQKLQQRLGTIVRSKEGKMVNVGSTIPFNLHNQVIAEDRTISRSNSGSLDLSSSRYHHTSNPHTHPNYYSPHHAEYNHSPLTRSRSRSASSSPSPSQDDDNDDIRSSGSTTSSRRRRRMTTEQPKPTPILNVRLVGYNKPPPSATMRGRARERGVHPSGLPVPKSPKGAVSGGGAGGATGVKSDDGGEGKSVSPPKIKKKPVLVLDDVSSIAVSWDD